MKIFSRIKAFFQFRGECAEVEVSAAEVKKGKVYLHPVDDPDHTYCIKSDDVSILISPNTDITEDDVEIIERPKKAEEEDKQKKEGEKEKQKKDTSQRERNESDPFKMRKMTISLYPDEYDALMENIKSNGYRKTEFLLASI